jgi:hypothetical protein
MGQTASIGSVPSSFSQARGSQMSDIVLTNMSNHLNQAAVERLGAAYWAQQYVSWVAEFGHNSHAANIYEFYQNALNWAEVYESDKEQLDREYYERLLDLGREELARRARG